MFVTLRKVWRLLPARFRIRVLAALKRSGLPHFFWYMAHFHENHSAENYAGNLPELKGAYCACDDGARSVFDKRFERIMDCLVLSNGVTKTTYARRHEQLLGRVLSDPRAALDRQSIEVLDVPSSAGMSSLNAYWLLGERFVVRRYVLGDRFLDLYLDEKRNCVFDEEGHLIQVRTSQGYASVYRPSVMGNEQGCLVRLLMFPLDRRRRKLQQLFPCEGNHAYTPIRLLHPEVEQALRDGQLKICKFDVFAPPQDRFDLILSFNLLQKNYFPTSQINQGIENLGRCLKEGGLLVLGDTTTFTVYRKFREELRSVWRES